MRAVALTAVSVAARTSTWLATTGREGSSAGRMSGADTVGVGSGSGVVGVEVGTGVGVGVGVGVMTGVGVLGASGSRSASAVAVGVGVGRCGVGVGVGVGLITVTHWIVPSNAAWWISPPPVWLKLAATIWPSTLERVSSDTAARGARIEPSTVALSADSVSDVAVGKASRIWSAWLMPIPEKFGAFQVPVVQSVTTISRVALDGSERKVIVPMRRSWSDVRRQTFVPPEAVRYGLTVAALQSSAPLEALLGR